MKAIKQIIVLLILTGPVWVFGQIYDKDSIFILERKSLEFGKAITGKSKNSLTGFTWHIKPGYFFRSGSNEFYNNPAAAGSLSLEFGCRLQFLEAGFRHMRTGFAAGSDYPYFSGFGGPNLLASYNLPALVGFVSNMGTATLHIPVKKVPLFINFGVGHSMFKYSDVFIRQEFYTDGTSAYVYVPNSFGTPAKIKAFTSVLGLGFSKGPFLAGLEWLRLRGKKDGFGNRYSSNFQNMYFGLQMNTGQKRNSPHSKKPETFNRKRVAVGVSRLVNIAPFKKKSGTGTGWTAEASVNIGKRTAILGSFQFSSIAQGYTKFVPKDGLFDLEEGTNIAGRMSRHLLYAGTSLTPRSAFQFFIYYGAGYYFLTDENDLIVVDPFPILRDWPDFAERSGGVVMGTGFQYKYIHSQILLHKSLRNVPATLEWNLGGRLLF